EEAGRGLRGAGRADGGPRRAPDGREGTPGSARMVRPARIGVLALQGDVLEHADALRRAGAEPVKVRDREELASVEGLVIPGGESSVIGMLLDRYGMMEPLRERVRGGMPVYGTCAGLILMAREIEGGGPPRVACLDVVVRRNAFGRQVD